MTYWWDGDKSERYWVEIRWIGGIGRVLQCPLTDTAGHRNGWYELVGAVTPGDFVYHWSAIQHEFVGRSEVASTAEVVDGERRVSLQSFTPLLGVVDLAALRSHAGQLVDIADRLRNAYGDPLYLPFQFRSDGLRMMSNYFAKLPREAVQLLFDASGVAAAGAKEPAEGEGPVGGSNGPPSAVGYLQPFRPKADDSYVTRITGSPQSHGRNHETLVNDFARWLRQLGHEHVGRNRVIDLGLLNPPVIIEAKIVGKSWASAIRAAVGQLYEYRFFQIVDPDAALIFLASKPVPEPWLEYLERDREIGAAWRDHEGFKLSRRASVALSVGSD
jgi:hypothetical protein